MNEYDSEVLLVLGVEVEVTYVYDEDTCAPWTECDGHGPVSEWTTRDKRPGERVLYKDGRSKRFYDWQAACKMARKDGWNTPPYEAPNRIERAVQSDFDFLRAWCQSDWYYVGVCVSVGNIEDSLWGVETWKDSHKECAHDMARTLVEGMQHEAKERAYWQERDVLTVAG